MPHHDSPAHFFYRHWSSEAPEAAVLLLHGFGENSSYFQRFAAELTRDGIDVWAIDHVGHGLTGDGQHSGLFESIEELATNAAELLEEIFRSQPGLPVVVVGHSLGGLTAVQLAAEYGSRLAGAVISGPPVEGCPENLPAKLTFSLDASYVDNARNDPLGITAEDAEANLWRAVSDFIPRMGALVSRIGAPVLVIFGEHDCFTTPAQAERWSAAFADARLRVVEGGHHDVLQDTMHRQLAAEISDFVQSCVAPGRARSA